MIPVFNIAKIRNSLPKNHLERMRSELTKEIPRVSIDETTVYVFSSIDETYTYTVEMDVWVSIEEGNPCNFEIDNLTQMVLNAAGNPGDWIVSGGAGRESNEYNLHLKRNEIMQLSNTMASFGFYMDEFAEIPEEEYDGEYLGSIYDFVGFDKSKHGYFWSRFEITSEHWTRGETDLFDANKDDQPPCCYFSIDLKVIV